MTDLVDAATGRAVTGPRADFFCERCAKDGHCSPEHPWRDLPLKFDAKGNEKKPRCPECNATRWMRRLYSGYSPRVSSAVGKATIQASDMLGSAGYDEQMRRKSLPWRVKNDHPSLPRIVSPNQLGAALAATTGGAIQGFPGLKPGSTTIDSIRPIHTEGGVTRYLQPPRPGPGSLKDNAKIAG